MSKTAFSKKCEILGSMWLFYRDNEDNDQVFKDFFRWADIGMPLAYMVWENMARPTADGKKNVEAAWNMLCEILQCDAYASYTSLDDMFDSPTLEEEEQ